MRIEPPPSLAVAAPTSPAATALAEPPLEPPTLRPRLHGFSVAPHVELSVNGKSRDITFDEQGKLVSAEEETSLDKIPAAARAAIEKGAGAGKIMLVETVTENGTTSYEAQVTTGKKKSEIKVDANGKTVLDLE